MIGAKVKLLAEVGQLQWAIQVRLDIATHLLDEFRIRFSRCYLLWFATAAWPVACCLGLFWQAEEGNVFASRVTGRTRRSAVDAGGAYCDNKLAIGLAFACHHGLPALLFI